VPPCPPANMRPRWPSASTTSGTLASRHGSTGVSRLLRSPSGPGHSVAVLLKVYAKCIDGQDQIAKRRIEDALGDPGDAPQESQATTDEG
jgi:hypothetical protein